MTLHAEKAHFTLLINDVVVGEVDNAQLPSGRVGIAINLYNVNDEVVFEFENFAVYVP